MKKFLIRCSSLSSIMADPISYPRECMTEEELAALACKKRTPAQIEMLDKVMAKTLSDGAKTHVHDLVRRHLYDYPEPELGNKEVRKGLAMETGAIQLLSDLTGEMYAKNEKRFNTDYLTGEPDIIASNHGVDTKVPWSVEQFPIVESVARKMAVKAGYEWQCRGYMHLTDKPRWAVAYALMETPSELMPPWESEEIHDVPLFAPMEQRITMTWFERDLAIEARIEKKCRAAQAYAYELIEQFKLEKQ